MNTLMKAVVLVAAGTLAGAALAQDVSDAADLTAVIALQGKPCGRVVSVARRGDNDYVATCEDGNRYHVYVRDGRVVVDEE